MIKGLIFDMDGTLIDSMDVWDRVDEDFVRLFHKEMSKEAKAKIEEMSFSESARFFIEEFQLDLTESEVKEIWRRMVYEQYEKKVPLKKGVMAFLKKNQAKKMAIVTSSHRELVDLIMKRFQLAPYITTIVTVDEFGINKTRPDIFEEAIRKLGLQKEECLIFEDAHYAVKMLKQHDFQVVGVYDKHWHAVEEEIKQMVDYYITDFQELQVN